MVKKDASPPAEEEELYIGDDDFMDGEDEEINIVSTGEGLDQETIKFDQIVGALSDVLLDPEFEDIRERFCRENCKHFEDTDENKLIYMDIFARYTDLIESAIDSRLRSAVAGFDMQAFLAMLNERQNELMSDVFDLLLSFGDFEAFREVMLAYKQEGCGGTGLQIQCRALHIHMEDQEDGEERPDLDMSLTISPVGQQQRAALALM